MRSQLRESAKESEVAVVKKEVLEKTAAIEQVMRDLQQKQQATLSRVKNVASAVLATCTGTPPRERMERTPPRERNRSPPSPEQPIRRVSADVPLSAANFSAGVGLPEIMVPASMGELANGPPGTLVSSDAGGVSGDAEELRWFESVKANLEHFGDVEVFCDNVARDCSCCLEKMGTPYGIRPRKCHHIFHIECLLQWWTEGTCPVCSASFAPDPDRVASRSQAGSTVSVGRRRSKGAGVKARPGSPLLARPAGAPGPGTFGGSDFASNSPS